MLVSLRHPPESKDPLLLNQLNKPSEVSEKRTEKNTACAFFSVKTPPPPPPPSHDDDDQHQHLFCLFLLTWIEDTPVRD